MRRIGRTLRDRAVQRRLGAAVLSGVLLALAFPAFDFGLLALVALVPLIWAWRDASAWRAALYGFVFGVVFAGILLYWLWYFGLVAIVPLVAGWGAYTALTGYLVGCLNRAGLRSPWLIAAAWVVPEALRARWPFGGLPWGDLGVALHDFPPARALASWGGVALVSFVIVVVNAYLVDLGVAFAMQTRRAMVVATAGIVVVVAVVAVADGARYQTRPSGQLRLATLQGNDQDRYLTTEEKRSGYLAERHFALAERLHGPYDVIVFPESSLDEFSPESNPGLRSRLVAVGRAHGADVLANAAVPAPDGREFNQNLLYTPEGRRLDRHRRPHPVRLHPGDAADDLPGQGPPAGHGHLLRVGLRAPRARLRRPRGGGRRREHEQPLVPAIGKLGAAHSPDADAGGRDGSAVRAGVDLGDQRRHRHRRPCAGHDQALPSGGRQRHRDDDDGRNALRSVRRVGGRRQRAVAPRRRGREQGASTPGDVP